MRSRQGFFQAAGELVDDPLSDRYSVDQVDALRLWFCDNLEVPTRFTRRKFAWHYEKDSRGLSWFKPTATRHIAKAFELKSVLDEYGYAIDVLKENRIGYILYEDEYQVVAEPFAETAM